MNDDEIIYLSADKACDLFSNGELSPVDLMQALIKRSELVEPLITAFTECYFDNALAQAKAAEARYQKGTQRPLEASLSR